MIDQLVAETDTKYDNFGRPSRAILGKKLNVVYNPETGKIITVTENTKKEYLRIIHELYD